MSNLPTLRESLESIKADRQVARLRRETALAVEVEHSRGTVQAAKVNAGAHLARTALINTAMLTKDEENLLMLAPLGEARYKAIVDAYAIYASGEVSKL